MAKRSPPESDFEDAESFSDQSEKKPSSSRRLKKGGAKVDVKPNKPRTVKKPKFDESSDEDETEKHHSVAVHSTPEGEKYIDLGKKKRATVRKFKGAVFVDVREFFGNPGEEKPGKKGISLGLEQWEALKSGASTIDSLFTELKS
ncbi:hypothetical protein SERLADRAFT_465594 [Serpula lacrymans var. lacrymans S7.9]|uniref:Transcriptional coactivator p15 (PC4) C-terminal domain-containing protein n=1 Tax=Serpula lacrymans var. lacrymans (strain S7.9) TaxID=578457 RepID=F8NSW7_SERL9|nr:uncharacterized protein SERLADRAFT_465594 [Serpula lacrymans var. lacrymans S7.9]EGO25440.1 hypothetical protein SERLADRAFT_465594 [Serpula lacrymans var. lacrymans S7.9]